MSGKKTIAENPQALIRYRILDRCLSNHVNRYYWEDLADAIEDYFGKRPSRRTVLNDLEALECDFGAMIDHVKDGRQVYYRYHNRDFSIFKNEMSEEDIQKLGEAVSILSRFKGLPQFEWMESLLPNKELDTQILSFGNDVEVLAPKRFREHIKEKISEIAKKYSISAD